MFFHSIIVGLLFSQAILVHAVQDNELPIKSSQSPVSPTLKPAKSSTNDNNSYMISASNLSFDMISEQPLIGNQLSSTPEQNDSTWNLFRPIYDYFVPHNWRQRLISWDEKYDLKARFEAFRNFMQQFNKQYKNQEEVGTRFALFVNHFLQVKQSEAEVAAGKLSYSLGMNQFFDWSDQELSKLSGKHSPVLMANETFYINKMKSLPSYSSVKSRLGNTYLPKSKSWVPYLGPVENQGRCGSCYAFSTLQTLKAMMNIKNGTNFSPSIQQIVDCVPNGCQGGLEPYVINYLNSVNTMINAFCYPYEARRLNCETSNKPQYCKKSASIDGKGPIKMIRLTGESQIVQYLANHGPLAGGLYASNDYFFYKKGIYSGASCPARVNQNHAVVLAGYGEENGVKYYLMKNSWGTSWGDNGYMKIKRGNNECSVDQEAYAIFNK